MSESRPYLPLLFLAALFGVGWLLRQGLGIELSTESIRLRVHELGWYGPALFLLLLTFRSFLLIPSSVLLLSGGMLFGVGVATLLGGVGVFLSALLWFVLAHALGRDWLRARLGRVFEQLEPHMKRAGPLIVGLCTAHPAGPTAPVHVAAGMAGLAPLPFVLAAGIGSPARAFTFSFFGSTLADVGSGQFFAATAVILGVFALPLLHPGLRRRLTGRAGPPRDEPPGPGTVAS